MLPVYGENSIPYQTYSFFQSIGFTETSVRYEDYFAQNSFTDTFIQYDADFCTNSWYTERTNYDLSSITVPMKNIYVNGDTTCNENLNIAVQGTIPSAELYAVYDIVNAANGAHSDIAGWNTDAFYSLWAGMLASGAQQLVDDVTCPAEFSTWEAEEPSM